MPVLYADSFFIGAVKPYNKNAAASLFRRFTPLPYGNLGLTEADIVCDSAAEKICIPEHNAEILHQDLFFNSGVILFIQIAMVEPLCRSAESDGEITPPKPSSSKAVLNPTIKR